MTFILRPPSSDKEFEEYFNFRWKNLRKPMGLEQGSEKDELENSAFHIAAFQENKIIAVGRLQTENSATARIRYMAVGKPYRKQGIGSAILASLEENAIKNNVQNCWLLAREEAIPFYLKNNYEVKGVADSDLVIKHRRMEKIF